MMLVVNARYLLMSCALSQHLSPDTPLAWRMLIAYDLTDAVFGLAIAQPGYLDVWYYVGAMCAAMPGWSLGTVLGVLMGDATCPRGRRAAFPSCSSACFAPSSSLSASKNRIVLGCIGVSFLYSFLASVLPFTRGLSEGMRILILTIVISAAAAICSRTRRMISSHENVFISFRHGGPQRILSASCRSRSSASPSATSFSVRSSITCLMSRSR